MRPFASFFAFCLVSLGAPSHAVDRLDARDFDTSVAACTDLYQFANGQWLKRTPVPAGLRRINRFVALEHAVQQQQIELVRELSQNAAAESESALSSLLLSVKNEAALGTARGAAMAALLPAIDQAQHPEQVLELLTSYQQRGLPVMFSLGLGEDGVVQLRGDMLTLPDPDFYLNPDPAAREWLGRYRAYVETMLTLAGSSDVTTDSAWVIDFEARIANALQTGSNAPLLLSPRDLAKRHPALQWKSLLKQTGLDSANRLGVQGDAAFAAANALLGSAHPVQWRAWLRFRVAHLLAPFLDAEFRDPHDRFIRKALSAVPLPEDADARALEVVQRFLPQTLAWHYQQRYLPGSRREGARAVLDAVREALAQSIAGNQRWEPATRELASAKLKALRVDWGLLEAAPDLTGLKLSTDNLVGNVLALNRWRGAQLAKNKRNDKLSRAVLRAQLGYQAELNRLQLSPALLQAPLYNEQADAALQFAGLGALIAHELAHGFDLGGASFDASGAAKPWWSEADRAAFLTAVDPLRAQYAGYVSIGERRVDGDGSLIENAADLSGLQLAWQAWRSAQADPNLPLQDGLSPAQRFFVAWASVWRENALDAARLHDAEHSEQAPAALRAIGPLPHVAGFSEAFKCAPDSAMRGAGVTPVQAWP